MAKANLTSTRKKEDPTITRQGVNFIETPEYLAYIMDQANRGNTYNLYRYARLV